MDQDSTYREISSPLRAAMLAPLGPRCERVVIGTPLAGPQYPRIAALMERHHVVDLMVFTHGAFENLDFLRGHPSLKRATVTMDSHRKNTEVKALLGYPEVEQLKGGFQFR